MKKLFVLFLLVALVPFTVGCSLWGHDKDEDVIEPTAITLAKTFPAGTLGGDLKAAAIALKWNMLFLRVNGNRFGYKNHENTETGVKVYFQATLPLMTAETILGQTVPVEVLIEPKTGVEVTVVAAANEAIPTSAKTSTLTSAPSTTAVSSIPATVEQAIKDALAATGDTVAAAFEVDTIKFGATEISTSSTTPTSITKANSYVFTVKLSEAYANTASPTWTVAVKDTADTTAKTLTNDTSSSPLAVTSADKTTVTITVTPSATYPMNVNKTFSIVLTATNAVNAAGTAATLPAARFIKIVQ